MTELTDVSAEVLHLANAMHVAPAPREHKNGAQMPDVTEDEQQSPMAEDATLARWKSRTFTLEQFLQRPPKEWLVQDVLGVGDFCMLYGEPGSAKTFVALDLALAAATQGVFAGRFAVARPLSVAYFAGEGAGGLAGRLRAVTQHYGVTQLPVYVFPDALQLFMSADEDGVLAFLHAWQRMADAGEVPEKLDVVIIDTLHAASAGAEENSAKDAGVILKNLRRLRELLGCACVLVHHANKNGDSERGSTAFRGAMDTLLRTQKTGKSFTLKCEKGKDFEQWQAQAFALEPAEDSVYVTWTGEAKGDGKASKQTEEQRLFDFLIQHGGQKYTTLQLALEVHGDAGKCNNVHRTLTGMAAAGSIFTSKERQQAGATERDVIVWWTFEA